MQRIMYGVPVQSLEEVLSIYMVQQGNSRRSHFADYMITAGEVWEKLFRDTIWDVRSMVVDVDQTKNTIQLPQGMERLLSISVIDHCNNLQPITYDPNINTLQVRCHPKKCSCKNCYGEGTLCDAIDSITMRTFPVVLNTITYYGKIWNHKDGCDIKEVTETPTIDGDEIGTYTQTRTVCSLEVDEKGCIKATEPNRQHLMTHCGCFIPECQRSLCDEHRCTTITPPNYSNYGFWKQDAICDGIVHLKDVKAEKVIISFQPAPDGTDKFGQVMVPGYAKDAVMFGLYYYSNVFKNGSRSEKIAAEDGWVRAKRRLFAYLYPISLDEFSKLNTRRIKW